MGLARDAINRMQDNLIRETMDPIGWEGLLSKIYLRPVLFEFLDLGNFEAAFEALPDILGKYEVRSALSSVWNTGGAYVELAEPYGNAKGKCDFQFPRAGAGDLTGKGRIKYCELVRKTAQDAVYSAFRNAFQQRQG
ncbi:MAG: hypothetical protein V1820_03825 [archaeon]